MTHIESQMTKECSISEARTPVPCSSALPVRPLRVLLAGKAVAPSAVGGGEIQMQATAHALGSLGMTVRLGRPGSDDLAGVDCLHLFGSLPEHLPLVEAAKRHPNLASEIIEILANNRKTAPKAIRYLREFATDEEPAIRAAAMKGLYSTAPGTMQDELSAGLRDADDRVRIAAATVLVKVLGDEQEKAAPGLSDGDDPFGYPSWSGDSFPAVRPSMMARALRVIGLGNSPDVEVVEEEPELVKDAPEADDDGPSVAADATEDEKPEPPPERPMEQWLRDFHAGKGRPKWMTPLIEPLQKMLRAEDGEERVAAAVPLVALGKAEEALPVLIEATGSQRALFATSVTVLRWLTWDERLRVYRQLQPLADGESDHHTLVRAMITIVDDRAADLLWELLAGDDIEAGLAHLLQRGLQRVYYGEEYVSDSNITPVQRRETAAAAKKWATTGTEWQRVMGLALLLHARREQAAEVAQQLVDDPQLDDRLRQDAYQILLAAQSPPAARRMAAAALSSEDAPRRKMALHYLVGDGSAIGRLRDVISLSVNDDNSMSMYYSDGEPIVPEPPKGLKVEQIRPLLDDPDPKTAAYAGYLLALFDDPSGMEKLLQFRRKDKKGDGFFDEDRLDRLTYRAIAVLNDPKHVPVLEEIYAGMAEFKVAEFYWTIRIMSGTEVVLLRKKIRDKVGMSNLR